MKTYSTRQAAQKLGLHPTTLADYVAEGKVPMPQVLRVGTASLHAWTDEEIEHVRQLLPKIANGRKTRYKKQSAKTKAQPKTKSAAPRKKEPKKK
jgi:predicted DNA-binding transcriptional regulator AlpA